MNLTRPHPKRGRIEMIPMIDTILILLIFYMSFSSFRRPEQRLDVPLAFHKGESGPVLQLNLHVRDANHIQVNQGESSFTLAALRVAIANYISVKLPVTVTIEADADTQYAAVIGALDACAEARLKHVAFRPIAEEAKATP